MAEHELEFNRGPLDEHGEHMFDQERLERDFHLTQRVQIGYTPAEPTEELPIPRVIDGNLDADGQEAMAELWDTYKGVGYKAANEWYRAIGSNRPAIDFDDLLQESFFGVYHSALKWYPDKNITFLTHVRQSVTNYVGQFIDHANSAVRIPEGQQLQINQLNRVRWHMHNGNQRAPSGTQLAKALDTTPERVTETLLAESISRQMGTIDGNYFADDRDKHTIGDLRQNESYWNPVHPSTSQEIPVEDEALQNTLPDVIEELFERAGLTDREREILRLHHMTDKPHTLEDIGREFGVTRERIRQIEIDAFKKFRHYDYRFGLRNYFANQPLTD